MIEEFKIVRTNPYYVIDYSKVNTIEDIKVILNSLDIQFTENARYFDMLKPFLKDYNE